MRIPSNINSYDLEAVNRQRTEEEQQRLIDEISAAKPTEGPGIDRPPVCQRYDLADGGTIELFVCWSPFHLCVRANLHAWRSDLTLRWGCSGPDIEGVADVYDSVTLSSEGCEVSAGDARRSNHYWSHWATHHPHLLVEAEGEVA